MRPYVLAALAALTLVACGGGDTVTGPSPTTHQPAVSNPAPSTSTPTVVADPTPEPGGGPGPVSVNCQADGCHLSNSGNAAHSVTIACTEPLQTDPVYGLTKVQVPVGSDTLIIGPKSVCDKDLPEVRCEDVTRDVQIDFTAGQGEHIGHLMTKLTWENNAEDQWELKDNEPAITYEYGEWGECHKDVQQDSAVPKTCDGVQERTVIKITTVSHYWVNACELDPKGREIPEPTVTRTEQPNETRACTYPNDKTGDTPGEFFWNEEILEGQCEKEVLPREPVILNGEEELNCHQTGEQTIFDHYTCSESSHIRKLCQNVACPPPLVGTCFYNFAAPVGGQAACFLQPGFISWNPQNHLCELAFPGVDSFLWNLDPGQSAEGCLKHHGR